MKNVKFDMNYYNSDFMEELIEKYFSGGNVEKCVISDMALSESCIKKNANFFKHLKYLDLCGHRATHKTEILLEAIDAIEQLETLQTTGDITFEILQKLSKHPLMFLGMHGDISLDDEEVFNLPIFASTKVVIINNCFGYNGKFLDLFQNVERISVYTVEGGDGIFSCTSSLTKLKRLSLNQVGLSFSTVKPFLESLAEMNTLEEFFMPGDLFNHDKLTEILCKMTNLKKVHVTQRGLPYNNLLEIATKLPKLGEISIYDNKFPSEMNDLLSIFRAGKSLTKVFITFSSSFKKPDYDQLLEKISEIRKNQESEYIVAVDIASDDSTLRCKERIGIRNKWVRMVVPGE